MRLDWIPNDEYFKAKYKVLKYLSVKCSKCGTICNYGDISCECGIFLGEPPKNWESLIDVIFIKELKEWFKEKNKFEKYVNSTINL